MSFQEVDLNNYYKQIQERGDEVSDILGAAAASTWDHEAVTLLKEGNSVIPTVEIPVNHTGIVYTTTGIYASFDPEAYARSLMHDFVSFSREHRGFRPLAFACNIDASGNHPEIARKIGAIFAASAKTHDFAYLNGEYANLGSRVSELAKVNIVGTMIYTMQALSAGSARFSKPVDFIRSNKHIFMNSDGTGTKSEFSEARGIVGPIVQDSAEMKAGDAARVGSKLLLMHDVFEYSTLPYGVSADEFLKDAKSLARHIANAGNFNYRLIPENGGDRISTIHEGAIAQNCSGNAIGVLNPNLYAQLNSFDAGDYLIAFRGKTPNPRSNGISAWRTFIKQKFGDDYRLNSTNKELEGWLDYLTTPSTLTYSAVMDLTEEGLATFFTHMSGGALKSKLLSKIAKKGFGTELTNLFEPHHYQKIMISETRSSVENAYKAWPMGVDGFIATSKPKKTISRLNAHGLEARVVGNLLHMNNPSVGFTAYNGERIEYTLNK